MKIILQGTQRMIAIPRGATDVLVCSKLQAWRPVAPLTLDPCRIYIGVAHEPKGAPRDKSKFRLSS